VSLLAVMRTTFTAYGLFWGVWVLAGADIEQDLQVSHGILGLLLSVGLVGGALINSMAKSLTSHIDPSNILQLSLLTWSAAVAVVALSGRPVIYVTLPICFLVAAVVDVAMNVIGSEMLASSPARLVRLHALFNIGAALGVLATGVCLASGMGWRVPWLALAVPLLVAAAALALRRRAPAATSDVTVHAEGRLTGAILPRKALGSMFLLAAVAEGGIDLWGVLYLRTSAEATLGVAVSSASVGYGLAAAARLFLAPLAARWGALPGVLLGAAAASGGLLLMVVAPSALLAGVGFMCAASGIALCWPLLLAHAAQGSSGSAILGTYTALGYVGFLLGPVLVGAMAGVLGLRVGLSLLLVATASVCAVSAVLINRPRALAGPTAASDVETGLGEKPFDQVRS
jgi:MFS family permease